MFFITLYIISYQFFILFLKSINVYSSHHCFRMIETVVMVFKQLHPGPHLYACQFSATPIENKIQPLLNSCQEHLRYFGLFHPTISSYIGKCMCVLITFLKQLTYLEDQCRWKLHDATSLIPQGAIPVEL